MNGSAGGRNDDVPSFPTDFDKGLVLVIVGKFDIVGYLTAPPEPVHPFWSAFQVTVFDAVDKFTKTGQLGPVNELFVCFLAIKVYTL